MNVTTRTYRFDPAPSRGHVRAEPPSQSLDLPGRLRVAQVLGYLGVSHSTFYAGMKSGRYPKPDGYDGRMPFWMTGTVKHFLSKSQPESAE